jgi:hypothetical protein
LRASRLPAASVRTGTLRGGSGPVGERATPTPGQDPLAFLGPLLALELLRVPHMRPDSLLPDLQELARVIPVM